MGNQQEDGPMGNQQEDGPMGNQQDLTPRMAAVATLVHNLLQCLAYGVVVVVQ